MAPTHYLKIPFGLRDWYPGTPPDNWRDVINDDLGKGSRLIVEPLAPNDRGARVALRGERFYYEAGRDRDRLDTLFIMRLEPAEHRARRKTSVAYNCRLVPLPYGTPEEVDPVHPIFRTGDAAGPSEDEQSEPAGAAGADIGEPSPLLLSLLYRLPADVREKYRPVERLPPAGSAKDFLAPLQRLWRIVGSDSPSTPTARQKRLLGGGITPEQLGRKEREGLVQLFGFGLLNRQLARGVKADDIFDLLRDLSVLPPASLMRSIVWSSSLRGLESDALRRELHECAQALQAMTLEGADAEGAWEEDLLSALRARALSVDDNELKDVVAAAESADDPVGVVASWASRLQFSSPDASLHPDGGSSQLQGESAFAGPPAPVETLGTASSVSEAWVMRASLPAVEPLTEALAQLQALSRQLVGVTTPIADPSSALRLGDLLDAVPVAIQLVRRELPERDSLVNAMATARSLVARLQTLLGADAEAILEDSSLTAGALQDMLALLETTRLEQLPPWLWATDGDAPPEGAPTALQMARALADAERRHVIASVVEYAHQLEEPGALRWLRQPDPDVAIEHHVRAWYEGARDLLGSLSPEDRASLLADNAAAPDPSQLRRDHALLDALCDEVSPAVASDIRAAVQAAGLGSGRSATIAEYRLALDFFRDELGDPIHATFAVLTSRVEKQRRLGLPPIPVETRPLQLDHNWVEASGTRATLVFCQPDPSVAWGYVEAPIAIEADRPYDVQVRLELDVKGDHRRGWPSEWPGLEPSAAFRLPIFAWRRDPERKVYQVSQTLRIPIRVPTDPHPRLELVARAVDPVTGQRLSLDKALRWDTISTTPLDVAAQWIGTTNPAYVRQHPIGPQLNVNTLLDRLANGSSVAVVAPRRFGKSTLVEFLHAELSKRHCLTPPAAVCTLMTGPSGLDYARFWEFISDGLQAVLDVGLPRAATQGALPDDGAFDAVRRSAKAKGFGSIVILVDEAQLLFSKDTGHQLGTELKNRLERHWSRIDTPSMVPLRMAFIGLPSLQERAGVDLMGLLMPIERSEMKEDELRPLIAAMVTNLQTTKAARSKLTEAAGNLFTLRVLLERVAARVQREGRVWCSYDDVRLVVEELEDDLSDGRESILAQYIRDALNDAELVNEWEPTASFPVAAALAPACHAGHSFDAAVQTATTQLNSWGRLSQTDDKHIVSPTYDLSLVREHVARLEERRVLQQGQFTSRLLQAWLVGVNRVGTFDPTFQAALFRGSQRRIRIPSGVTPVGEGLEARVYRVDDLAYRVRPLSSDAERQQFLDSCRMLEALRGGQIKRESGSDFIFDLQEIGLSATNADEAVQVYHWVHGEDLSGKLGALNDDLVIDIGVKLARGVSLLHRSGILHRDIRPHNVIANIEDSGTSGLRPVLIDFGFARTLGSSMHTRLAGPFCAPEAYDTQPRWSRAADVYALGATLKALIKGEDQKGSVLTSLLGNTLETEPSHRPGVDDLLSSIDALAHDRKIEQHRQSLWNDALKRVAKDQHKSWFTRVLNKHRMKLEAIGMGFYTTDLERFRAVALFVEQVAEAFPPAGRLRLRHLVNDTEAGIAVNYLAALRILEAHSGDTLSPDQRDVWRRFQKLGPDAQRTTVAQAINRVADAVQLDSLTPLLMPYVSGGPSLRR